MEIKIRNIEETDCKTISDSFKMQGWDKPVSQYENYLSEQASGDRSVLLAFVDDDFAGYLTIKWQSYYPPFREMNIPEIMDLNVLIKHRNKGIATRLMDEAELIVSKRSDKIGIGVGLTEVYGNAQVLYIKRGYIPDRYGISYNERFLNHGDVTTVDDDLILCFIKELK